MTIREQLSTIHRNLVVSYDKGEKLGHVTNLYFEKSSCSIKGLSISPKWIKADKEVFVSFKDIHRLGKSVVIISSQTDLKKASKNLEGSSLRDLKGTKIVTEDGKHLGELLDVNVFAKSGIISDIVLYGPKNLKIDVEKDKISIGPDMIIVPAGYQNQIETQENHKNRFVSNAGNTTRSFTESIKSAVLGVASKKAKGNDKEPAKKEVTKPKSSPSPAKKPAVKKTAATPLKKRPGKNTEKNVAGK